MSISHEFDNLFPGYRTVTFKAGSIEPPTLTYYPLRLYGMRFCSDVYIEMLFMAIKRIPCQVINIDLRSTPEWYRMKNARGAVPTLEDPDNNTLLTGSLGIWQHLDKKFTYKRPQLWSNDENGKLRQNALMRELNRGNVGFIQENVAILRKYEAALISSTYLFVCWPYLERISGFGETGYEQFRVKADLYPNLFAYINRMNQLPEIKYLRKPARIFAEYRMPLATLDFKETLITDLTKCSFRHSATWQYFINLSIYLQFVLFAQ